jgi:hypothetical protein
MGLRTVVAQTRQRWRNLILGSATYLGLCLVTWCAICTDEALVCTHGTPIADMLKHSSLSPTPLVIDYLNFTNVMGLDTLALHMGRSSTDFQPCLLQ